MNKSDKNDVLWSWLFHEENIYDNRHQIFLTANALLAAAVGFSFGKHTSYVFTILVSVLGLSLCLIWAILQNRARKIIKELSLRLLKKDEFVLDVYKNVYQKPIKDHIFHSDFLNILPWVVVVFWFCLILHAILSGI